MNSSFFAVGKVQIAFALCALCAMILAPLAEVKGQAAPQGTITVEKEIVGTTTVSASDFSFLINGTSSTAFEADGSNEVTLATGTYDITEAQVVGYTPTYAGCDDILLTATNTPVCTITNTATTTGSSTSTPTTTTGMLVVNKIVNGGPAATSSFSFAVNGGANTAFEADGSNVLELATGTYSVTEVPAANYTPTYSNCSNVTIDAGATTTCTITNNFNVGGGQLYEITGIVWDDENEDGVIDSGESRLQNWTVSASQTGEITRTDTTDSNGRYALLVTGGEWLVSQTTQADWDQTFPSGNTHTVNATGTATSTIPLGDYNFGNDRDTSGGGGGGNGVRIELRDNDDDDDDNDSGGGRSDDDEDEDDDDDTTGSSIGGQVLGEQTSVFPYGAPDTGLGGMSNELRKMEGTAMAPLLGTVLVLLLGFGIAQAIRHKEGGAF